MKRKLCLLFILVHMAYGTPQRHTHGLMTPAKGDKKDLGEDKNYTSGSKELTISRRQAMDEDNHGLMTPAKGDKKDLGEDKNYTSGLKELTISRRQAMDEDNHGLMTPAKGDKKDLGEDKNYLSQLKKLTISRRQAMDEDNHRDQVSRSRRDGEERGCIYSGLCDGLSNRNYGCQWYYELCWRSTSDSWCYPKTGPKYMDGSGSEYVGCSEDSDCLKAARRTYENSSDYRGCN